MISFPSLHVQISLRVSCFVFFFFSCPTDPALRANPYPEVTDPKLRIRLADFPYLHCSNMPEAVHLGDLLRIWVRSGARFTPSPPDFQGPARAHRTPPEPRRFPRHRPLSRGEPIPGRPALHKEKRTLPGAPAGFSGIGCVTALIRCFWQLFCFNEDTYKIHTLHLLDPSFKFLNFRFPSLFPLAIYLLNCVTFPI